MTVLFDINLFAVFIAAVSSVFVGFMWFHPKVFGNRWIKLTNFSPEDVKKNEKRRPVVTIYIFLSSLISSFVATHALVHFRDYWGFLDIQAGISLAFLAWSAFVVPVSLSIALWEGKSSRLFMINAGYWLVSLVVMSLIITVLI